MIAPDDVTCARYCIIVLKHETLIIREQVIHSLFNVIKIDRKLVRLFIFRSDLNVKNCLLQMHLMPRILLFLHGRLRIDDQSLSNLPLIAKLQRCKSRKL